jgi:negative regulator of sigma-B (phosphoserine phosphatase)
VIVRCAFRCLPREGEDACGDAVHVRTSGNTTWIAMFDGLGHGPKAALASMAAIEIVGAIDPESAVIDVLGRLDGALRSTRGAAALLCRVSGGALSGCIVGNIELRSRGTSVPAVPTPGVLGRGIRRPRVFEAALDPGTRLLVFSDGLARIADLDDVETMDPEAACDELLRRHRRPADDTAIVVADFDGSGTD